MTAINLVRSRAVGHTQRANIICATPAERSFDGRHQNNKTGSNVFKSMPIKNMRKMHFTQEGWEKYILLFFNLQASRKAYTPERLTF